MFESWLNSVLDLILRSCQSGWQVLGGLPMLVEGVGGFFVFRYHLVWKETLAKVFSQVTTFSFEILKLKSDHSVFAPPNV